MTAGPYSAKVMDHFVRTEGVAEVLAASDVLVTKPGPGSLSEAFHQLSQEIASWPRVLCHRDYHSRNLMLHRGRLYWIDFQDARMGPVTYDLASLLRDSYVDLPEALVAALTQDHPRARMMTPAMVDQMNLDRSFAFYKDRFADASDFTFVFVGSFTLETIRPLVEAYLASLPPVAVVVFMQHWFVKGLVEIEK